MQPIEFIPYYYYSTVYYCFLVVICWLTTIYYVGSNTQKILHSEGSPSQPLAIFLTLVIALFLGLRPLEGGDFGDTKAYAHHYNLITKYAPVDFKTEWPFENFQLFSKRVLGLNIHEFFVLDDTLYFGGMLICSILVMRKNLWLGMLFFFTGFQTYSFAINGLRNGLACSMVLVAIALLANNKKRFVAIVLILMAMSIHRSSLLPSTMAIVSLFYLKDTKVALRFWYASIVLSLFAGPAFERFFASLGFDDRMSAYTATDSSNEVLYSGFRFDFLFYSTFPVWMIWYVTQRRKFTSPEYSVYANTYLLCNAFWILVIRASFSNRFAYLSWFLYPLVIAYPLMRMNLWKDQDRKTAIIFFFYTGFTFFMFFVYYFGTTGFRGFDQYWWRRI